MKRILKMLGAIVLLIIVGLTILLSYLKLALPDVGDPENLTIDRIPERVERGRYLANHVCVCVDCHSTRDWSRFSGPLVDGTLGKGGEVFDQTFGFPGSFHARNITPSGIGTWSDGEVLRAISCGVSKDGSPLFPVMPHPNYGKMDKEDLLSIISYIRSLDPIEHVVPSSVPDFPMNFIINTIPKKAEFSKMPDKSNKLAYGAYLFNAAACAECHTKQEKGKKVEGMDLAGGFEFPFPTGEIVRSANITPDRETGIGKWSEEAFVSRFRKYADSTTTVHQVAPGNFQTVMPWTMYGRMSEEDLRALYVYLRTVKPIRNTVEKFSGS